MVVYIARITTHTGPRFQLISAFLKMWCSLLVEEIDIGEAKCRQVVSGLAKYCTPDQLTVWMQCNYINTRIVLVPFFFWTLGWSLINIILFFPFICYMYLTESPCGTYNKCETWKITRCDVRRTGMLPPPSLYRQHSNSFIFLHNWWSALCMPCGINWQNLPLRNLSVSLPMQITMIYTRTHLNYLFITTYSLVQIW